MRQDLTVRERSPVVRFALLISIGIHFDEDDQDGAGCAGPVWVVLRLDMTSLAQQGGASMLDERLPCSRQE